MSNPKPAPSGGRMRPWFWVLAVFALQIAAWTAWMMLAARHPVAEVPLTTSR